MLDFDRPLRSSGGGRGALVACATRRVWCLLAVVGVVACRFGSQPVDDTGLVPQAGLDESGVVECAEPEKRGSNGAFYEPDLGADWVEQLPSTVVAKDVNRGGGVVIEDFNGDGRFDVFLPNPSGPQWLFQDTSGALIDATGAAYPPADISGLFGAAAADLDADGDVDIVVPRVGHANGIFVNDGTGGFTFVSESIGMVGLVLGSLGASVADYDGDDTLDIFFANHTTRGESGPAPPDPGEFNELYRGQGGLFYEDVGHLLPVEAREGYSFIGGWVDLDLDGDLDLYVVNDYGQLVTPNNVAWNEQGAFTAAEESSGLDVAGMTMGLGVADVNEDGRPDLAISDYRAVHVMLSAEDGQWYNYANALGVLTDAERGQHVAWGVEWADLDHDMDLDLLVTFGPFAFLSDKSMKSPEDQPDALWLQRADGTFEEVAAEWEMDDRINGRGLVVMDFDRDGFLDVFKADLRGDGVIARFARCDDTAWMLVRLEQSGGNPRAIGARVEVDIGDRTLRRWVQVGSTGLASSAPPEVHFGLGEASRVDAMRVVWPDGTEDSFGPIATRQFLTVDREGLGRVD